MSLLYSSLFTAQLHELTICRMQERAVHLWIFSSLTQPHLWIYIGPTPNISMIGEEFDLVNATSRNNWRYGWFLLTSQFTKALFLSSESSWTDFLLRFSFGLTKDLNNALKVSKATWKIVVGHHPIRSIGSHDDTAELKKQLLPILEVWWKKLKTKLLPYLFKCYHSIHLECNL